MLLVSRTTTPMPSRSGHLDFDFDITVFVSPLFSVNTTPSAAAMFVRNGFRPLPGLDDLNLDLSRYLRSLSALLGAPI
jgi:hypothetical protein